MPVKSRMQQQNIYVFSSKQVFSVMIKPARYVLISGLVSE